MRPSQGTAAFNQSVKIWLQFVLSLLFLFVQKFGGMGADAMGAMGGMGAGAMGGMDFSVCNVLSWFTVLLLILLGYTCQELPW